MFSCLDTSIVSTALVSLSIEFENYEDAPWVILGYLLTYMSASNVLLRLSRRLTESRLCHWLFQAQRRVRTEESPRGGLGHLLWLFHMVCAFALHGSTVCCQVPRNTNPALTDALRRIAARSLQGIGGSGLYSLAQVCLVEQGPNRPEIVGALVGITLSISYILGPLLGGAISEWTWRGIFWIKYVSSHADPSQSNLWATASRSVSWPCLESTCSGRKSGGTGTTHGQASPKSTLLETCCSSSPPFS